jgi:hypothetical protein
MLPSRNLTKHIKIFNYGLLILFEAIFLDSVFVNGQTNDEKIIAYAKQIYVSSLDSTLPNQPIEMWLKYIVGPKGTISWEANDCGEQTGVAGDSSNDFPLCAEVVSKLADGRKIGIQIVVGTYKTGISGKPDVFYIYIDNYGEVKSPIQLRELPSLVKEYLVK